MCWEELPRGWRAFYGVTALGLALHIAGDVITSYGTMILAPLSDWRAQIGTTFIVDPWFSGIIVAGLVASAALRRSRWPAVAASAVLLAYVGFQYLQKEKAIEFGERYARSLGPGGASVNAQNYPQKPIRLILPVPPGGVADVIARPLAQKRGGELVIHLPDGQTNRQSFAKW